MNKMKRYLSLMLLSCFLLVLGACVQTQAESTEETVASEETSAVAEQTEPAEQTEDEEPTAVDPMETLQALANADDYCEAHSDISVDQAAIELMEARCEAIKAYVLGDWFPPSADTALKVGYIAGMDSDGGEPDYVEITDREVIASVTALLSLENIHAGVATPELTDLLTTPCPQEYADIVASHDDYAGEDGKLILLFGNGDVKVTILTQDSTKEFVSHVTAFISGGDSATRIQEVPFLWTYRFAVPSELQNVLAPYLPGLPTID